MPFETALLLGSGRIPETDTRILAPPDTMKRPSSEKVRDRTLPFHLQVGAPCRAPYRKPFDLLTEGLYFSSCGADDLVTRTLDRVVQGFREALASRNDWP
ncbi:MAG: hypothetical protein KAY24_15450 [Candidatus Eisenbacteria sp.]|nr:hypothetical protein [Candidatus Eisenbacteria bacterium]